MSTLNRDLLYEISEKLLYPVGDYREDLFKTANFMLVNTACKNAFLSQFSKMKVAEIFFRLDGMEVNLYKDRNFYTRGFDMEYKGPYVTDAAFISFLMQHDRFHPRTIQINSPFSNCSKSVGESAPYSVPGATSTSAQGLATILNLKHVVKPKADYLFDYVEVYETKGRLVDLGLVLALDAKKMVLDLRFDGYHCSMQPVKNLNASSKHIEVVSITFNSHWDSQTDDNESYTEFPHDEWIELLSAIFTTCPALKKLKIRVNFEDSYEGCMNLLLVRLQKSMQSITQRILPEIYKNTPPPANSSVKIEFCAFLNCLVIQDVPIGEYDLFKFGKRQPGDEGEIIRAAKFDRKFLKIVDEEAAGDSTKSSKINTKSRQSFLEESDEEEPGCVVGFAIFRSDDGNSDEERQVLEDILDYTDAEEDIDYDGDEVDYYDLNDDDVDDY